MTSAPNHPQLLNGNNMGFKKIISAITVLLLFVHFGRTQSVNSTLSKKESGNRDIQVSVLLPFDLSEVDTGKSIRGNTLMMLDIYRGIEMAREQLENDKVTIDLRVFDTGKSGTALKSVLNDETLVTSDFLIGPMYGSSVRDMKDFVRKKKMIVLNPVFTDTKESALDGLYYTLSPGYGTEGAKAADFLISQLNPKKGAIFYENSTKSKTMAETCKDWLIAKGIDISITKELAPNNTKKADTLLREDQLADLDFIFLTSGKASSYTSLIKLIDESEKKVPLLCHSDILEDVDFEYIDREYVYMVYPRYIDKSRPEVSKFEANFIAKNNIIPSQYAYMGHDLMYYIGQLYKKYGKKASSKICSVKFDEGLTLEGIFFSEQGYDNKVVPIVHVEDGELKVVSR